MKLYKNNLEQETFKIFEMAQENVVIISPFISLNVSEKLVDILKKT